MNSEQHRVTAIRHWWLKAEESLRSAERELLADSLSFAINRIYYSVFYAVSAAMLERQIVSKKHTGVRAAFHREFIKTNVLDSQWGRFYDRLFEDRQEGDYIVFTNFDREYVQECLARCREFHTVLYPLISSLREN